MSTMQFAKKSKKQETILSDLKWKILVVDDEPSVHSTTKSVLRKFIFENKKLEILSAYNGKEAIDMLRDNPDIAIVLLDVVMESDDSGLMAAKRIRDELNNKIVRIVLRTGQPGTAPEKDVILNYDINDYKEKTELSSLKLFTTVISSLRSFKDLALIEQNRAGLENVIDASKSIFKLSSLVLFVEGVLAQLVSILDLNENPRKIKNDHAFFATLEKGKFKLLATRGKFKDEDDYNIITPKAIDLLDEAYINKKSFVKDNSYVGFFKSKDEKYIFLYLEAHTKLSEYDKNFLTLFLNNVSIAFENVCLNGEVLDTQKEMIGKLGEVVENRSKETANHVNRVAMISYVLAKAYGFDEDEANKLKMASPMHDIGKVATPDAILLKPGKLDNEELGTIKKHAEIGWEILKGSNREILKIASTVAYEHHERWDGNGYPRGLKGEDIHIYGRITAIADVFDALTQKRVYKDAWSYEEALELLEQERGKQFDPKLIDLFLENFDKIKSAIKEMKD